MGMPHDEFEKEIMALSASIEVSRKKDILSSASPSSSKVVGN